MVGHLHIGILATALLGVGIVFLKSKKSPSNRRGLYMAGGTLVATAALLLLSHFKSDFIWGHIPPLAYVQFPWRFVVWAGIPLVVTSVLLLSYLPAKARNVIVVLGSLSLLIYSYPFFFPKAYDGYTDADLLTGKERHEQQAKSLYDYLPITVKQVPDEYADDSQTKIKTFYFPGWSATVGGVVVAIEPDPVHGLIRPAQPVEGELVLAWHETPFRLSMDVISLISVIGYGFYLWKSHVQ
jgi:hypothetical protein